jgi:hypothetical protein
VRTPVFDVWMGEGSSSSKQNGDEVQKEGSETIGGDAKGVF